MVYERCELSIKKRETEREKGRRKKVCDEVKKIVIMEKYGKDRGDGIDYGGTLF